MRPQDIVTRSGGEEFVVLLQVHDQHELLQIAERVSHAIRQQPLEIDNQPLNLTISIGAALRRPQEQPMETLKRADQALYHAKGGGRNRVELSD